MTEEQEKYYDRAIARHAEINPAYHCLIIAELEKELEEHECMIRRISSLVEQYEFSTKE